MEWGKFEITKSEESSMHEWALAEAVVSTAIKAAEKEKLVEITKIKIRMGELQQIDTQMFESVLKEVIQPQKPILKNAHIEMEREKAVLRCRACGIKWDFEEVMNKLTEKESESIHFIPEVSHCYIRCPGCKSPDFEVVEGRGVWIDSIEGE